jgi:hypothetical protein
MMAAALNGGSLSMARDVSVRVDSSGEVLEYLGGIVRHIFAVIAVALSAPGL